MTFLTLYDVPDAVLSRQLHALVALKRMTNARLLAHLAEFDRRRLYAPAGYPSMFAYCIERLGFSEGGAYIRIEVARKSREFPQLLCALADGRIHLTGVRLLLPHLLPENVETLIETAAHRTRRDIEIQLARLFPRVEPLRLDEGVSAMRPVQLDPGRVEASQLDSSRVEAAQLDPGRVETSQLDSGRVETSQLDSGRVETRQLDSGRVEAAQLDPGRVEPITGQRFSITVTVSSTCHEKLRRAQALLRHAVPRAEIEEVLERALDALLDRLARKKHAATRKPQLPRRRTDVARSIPAWIKRAVWERDGGRCTFVGANGHRCKATEFLEFDHVTPVAKGGKATVDNLRLRCRTHNRLEAVRQFGEKFMQRKEGRPKDPGPLRGTTKRE